MRDLRRGAAALHAALCGASIFAAGCSCSAPQELPQATTVPAGAFAVVGGQALSMQFLAVARRSGANPHQLGAALAQDALLAAESRRVAPARARVVERGLAARALLEQVRAASLSGTPATQAELDEQAGRLWAELDRPRMVRTAHVYTLVPEFGDGQLAFRVMTAIAEAVRGAATPAAFSARVQTVPTDGIELGTGAVPPIAADGRVYLQTAADQQNQAPPQPYASSALQLKHVGDTSDVVATASAFHVLLALDILSEHRLPQAERDRRLSAAVADARVARANEQLRQQLRGSTAVTVNPHHPTLTRLVWRAP